MNWFLRDFGYDTEMLGRDEVDETAVGLKGVVKISHIFFNGLPCYDLTVLPRPPAGMTFPGTSLGHVRRWRMTYTYTQISHYLSCPRRYRHRYLDGWQEKDTRAAMLFGRAFEKAVAALFRREDSARYCSRMERV